MEEQHKAHQYQRRLENKTKQVQFVLEKSKRQKVAEYSALHSEKEFIVENNQPNDEEDPMDTSPDPVPTQNFLDDYDDYKMPGVLWKQYKLIVGEMLEGYKKRHNKYPPAHLLTYYVSMDRRFVKHLQKRYNIYFSDDDIETARYKGTDNLKAGETFHIIAEQSFYSSLPNDVDEILQLKRHRYTGRILGNAYETLQRHLRSPLPNVLLSIGRDQLVFVARGLADHDEQTLFFINRANDWKNTTGQETYKSFNAEQKLQWQQLVSDTRAKHIESHQNELKEIQSRFATDLDGKASNAKYIDGLITDTRDINTLRDEANKLFESDGFVRNIQDNMRWTSIMGEIVALRENVVHRKNIAEHDAREKREERKQVQKDLRDAIDKVVTLEGELRMANDNLEDADPRAGAERLDIEPMCARTEEDARAKLKNSQMITELQNVVTEAGRLLMAEKVRVDDLTTRSYLLKVEVEQARRVGVRYRGARKTNAERESNQREAEEREGYREAEIKREMELNGLTRELATERVDCKELFSEMDVTIDNIKTLQESLDSAKTVKKKWEEEKKGQIQDEFDRRVQNASELLEKIKDAISNDFVAVQSVVELEELAKNTKKRWKSLAKDEKVEYEGTEYGWEELYNLSDEIIQTERTSSQFVIEKKKHLGETLLNMLNSKHDTNKALLKSQWEHWNTTLNAARTKRQALDLEFQKFKEKLLSRLRTIGNMEKIRAMAVKLYAVMDDDSIDIKSSNDVAGMVADPNDKDLQVTLISMFGDIEYVWQDVLKDCLINGRRIRKGLSQLKSSVVSANGEKFQGLLDQEMELKKEIADADLVRCTELKKYYDIVDADRTDKIGRKIGRKYEAMGPMNSDLVQPMFVQKGKEETQKWYLKAGLDATNPFVVFLVAKNNLKDEKGKARSIYKSLVSKCSNHSTIMKRYEQDLVSLDVKDLSALRVAAQASLVPERLEDFKELREQIASEKLEEKDMRKAQLPHVFGFSKDDNLDKKLNLAILEINRAAKKGSGRAKHYYQILCNIFKLVIQLEDRESAEMGAVGKANVRTIPLQYQGQFEELNCDAQNDLSGEPEIPKPVFEQMRKSSAAIKEYYDKIANVVYRWESIRPELRAGAWPTMEERAYLVELSRKDASGNEPRIDEDTGEVVFMSQWNKSRNCNSEDEDKYPNTVIWIAIDNRVLPVDHDGKVVRMLREISGGSVSLTAVLHRSLEELKEYQRDGKTTKGDYARASSWARMQKRYGEATRDLQIVDIEGNVALKQAHITHELASKNNADLVNKLQKLISEERERVDRMHRNIDRRTRDYNKRVPVIDDVARFLPLIEDEDKEKLSTLRTGANDVEHIREVSERIQSIEDEISLIQRENERFPTSQPWLLSLSLTRSSNKVVSISNVGGEPLHTAILVKYLQNWEWVWDKGQCEFAKESVNKWLDTCYAGMPNMHVPILGRGVEDDLKSRMLPWLASLYHNGFEFPQIDLTTKTVFLGHILPQAKLRFGLYPNTSMVPEWLMKNSQWSYNTVATGNWIQHSIHKEQEIADSDKGWDNLATRIRNNNIDSAIAQTSSSNHGDIVTIFNEAESMRVFSPKPDTDEEFLRSSSAAVASLTAASFPGVASPVPNNLWLDLVDKTTVYQGTLDSVPKQLQAVVLGALNDALKQRSRMSMEITFIVSNKLHRIHFFDINSLDYAQKNDDAQKSYDRWLGANTSYPAPALQTAEQPPPASSNIGQSCGHADSYTGFSKGDTVLYVSKSRGDVMATVLEAGILMPETCGLPNSYTVQLHNDQKTVINTTHKHLVRVLDALPETLVTSTKYLSLTYDPGPISSPYDAFGKPKRAKKK
tara:strand:+ start:3735 stop:9233 length:5499 start_codon:yes stop_codon:yes gene_type:complete